MESVRHKKIMFLFILILNFCPIFFGYDFLPFHKYPKFARGLIEGSGQNIKWNPQYQEIWQKGNSFLFEIEPAWFTINLPQDLFFSKEIRKGRIPFWDPYTGCGTPTFGSGQFRPFNPIKVVFYLFPTFWGYSLFLFIQLLLGTVAFYYWNLKRGISEGGALFGSFVYSLNPFILSRIGLTDGATYLIFPFVLLALEYADEKVGLKSLAFLSLSLVWLGNVSHSETFVLFSGVGYLYFLCKKGDFKKRIVFLSATTFIVSVSLLPLWLPFINYYLNSFSYKSFAYFIYPYNLKTLFSVPSDMFIPPVLLFLFLLSLVKFKNEKFWLISLFLSLILMIKMPFLGNEIAHFVEKYSGFQIFYLKCLFWFSLSAFFAKCFEQAKNFINRNKTIFVLLIVSTLNAVFNLLIFYFNREWETFLAFPSSLVYIVIIFSVVILWLQIFNQERKETLLFLSLLSVFVPFSFNNIDWNRAVLKESDVISYLRNNHPSERVVSIAFHPSFVLPPNWGQSFGIRQGEINSAIFPNEYFKLFYNRQNPVTFIFYGSPEIICFQQMGATSILLPNQIDLSPLKKEFSGSWATVYKIPDAMGRFFFAKKWVQRDFDKDLSKQIVDLGEKKDGFVTVESSMGSKISEFTGDIGKWKIEVLKDEADEIEVKTENEENGLFVLRDSWNEGWKAYVNGEEREIFKINGCFRGLFLEKGENNIIFKYKPLLLILSLKLSFAMIFLLLSLVVGIEIKEKIKIKGE